MEALMNILALIGIAIGGAIGALSRGLLTRMLKRRSGEPLCDQTLQILLCLPGHHLREHTGRSSARLRTGELFHRLIDQ